MGVVSCYKGAAASMEFWRFSITQAWALVVAAVAGSRSSVRAREGVKCLF